MKIEFDFDQTAYVVSKAGRQELRHFMRERREKLGLTQGAVERRAGLLHPLYRNFESGETKSCLNALMALPALGVDIFLFGTIMDLKEVGK